MLNDRNSPFNMCMIDFYLFKDRDNEQSSDTGKEEEIVHTGSGGAFDETESATDEAEWELSDEQLDERLENPEETSKKPPAY
ncbi:hypothetical protein SAMN04488121_110142 [Chitinophaga filiformis]|uniref:Uncharacterized protein n=2 Tax=Chitinophaga filiformis TaxID=104663 RepID=A0A1G8B5P8_CHIFI|nr:hypothetical protein SAMN04488121_110142 [Chitinophaga filiformis]